MPEKNGKSGTKKQMIRLPVGIIDHIDGIIEDNKTFATKPDFIIHSMRIYQTAILISLSVLIEDQTNPESSDEDLSKFKGVIDDPDMLTYVYVKSSIGWMTPIDEKTIKSETKPIMITIPIGMYEEIEYLINKTKIAKSMIEFIKQSISYGISKDMFHDAVLDLSAYIDEHGKISENDKIQRIKYTTQKIASDIFTDDAVYTILKKQFRNLD